MPPSIEAKFGLGARPYYGILGPILLNGAKYANSLAGDKEGEMLTLGQSGENGASTYPESGCLGAVLIEGDRYKSPMAVLTAFVKELSHNHLNVQKIAVFEEPPIAILHIKTPHQNVKKPAWLKRLITPNSRLNEDEMTVLELKVAPKRDVSSPFRLNCQIIPAHQYPS